MKIPSKYLVVLPECYIIFVVLFTGFTPSIGSYNSCFDCIATVFQKCRYWYYACQFVRFNQPVHDFGSAFRV